MKKSAKDDARILRAPFLVDAHAAAALIRKLGSVSSRDGDDPQEDELIPAPLYVDTAAAVEILSAVINAARDRRAQTDADDDSEGGDAEMQLLRMFNRPMSMRRGKS